MLKKIVVLSFVSGLAMMSLSQSSYAMRQPAMDNALQALENAERLLKKASPNKGGHRVKALRAIKAAKKELRQGITFANRRADDIELRQRREREAGEKLRLQNEARERTRREAEARERRNLGQRDRRQDARDEVRSRRDRQREAAVSPRDKKYNTCVRQSRNNERKIRECNKKFGKRNNAREERREGR